jgi:DNA-binding transcriptional regulator YbjK
LPKGTSDPERADRIATAALEVVKQNGLEGLTHRAVAAIAQVPLGSTTYHYKSLDDLLAAALTKAKATTDAEIDELSDRLEACEDLAAGLTDYLYDLARSEMSRTIIEYQLYLAALRRPALRTLSLSWGNALPSMLARHTDAMSAQALAYVCDGVLLQSIVQGYSPSRADIEGFLRRAAASP